MPPTVPLKLLLIEDSPHDAELTQLTLEKSGLRLNTTRVYNHQGAEQALLAGPFDLILCDLLLPGSSGVQVLHIALALAPQVPFIFLSGVFGEQHAVEMMRLGATDYVLKQNFKLLPKAVMRALAEVHERLQRRLAEDTLQEVEIRARLAMNAARMGLWDYDPVTGSLIWDERCKALYGLPAEHELDLAQFYARTHADDRAALRQKTEAALATGSGFEAEYRVLLPDGGQRWVSSSGQSVFENGQCVQFTGVIQDISERKEASEAMQRLNAMLGERVQQRTRERDRTWELSRELLAVLRFDMSPVAFNPAWEEALGWSREKLANTQFWELVHPEDIPATVHETESIASGNVSTRFVNRMRHFEGGYRWLSWTMVPDEGLIYAAVRDITSERYVVDELAAANQQLREQIDERQRVEATLQQMQRLEVVGQLTAGVAHDFNNLLTVILASVNFLERDVANQNLSKSASRLNNIREAGERGAKLTSQLLAFSRRQRLEPLPVNLNDTIVGMHELLDRALGGSIRIETDLATDLWSAMVDPTQTEMIILNLAINARDAMALGGTLALKTRNEVVYRQPQRPEHPEPGTYVVLSINDSGSGMSEEVLAKAFEPFFTTKDVGKGSGLGLAQVFGFAKQSGGGVAIQTETGKGTTVQVYLPAVAELATPDQTPAEAPLATGSDHVRHTILLVDDDANVRGVTAGVLDALGYQVIEADSGAAALGKMGAEVELLLTDFAMPGMTGAELAVQVRQKYPQLPIIFITGYAELSELAANDEVIIQKPYREDDLANKLRRALNGSVKRS